MAGETSKTRQLAWGDFENSILFPTNRSPKILDIGPEKDPLPNATPFDKDQGDANHILDFVIDRDFDVVYSSHCLEHIFDPRAAIKDWWKLVRPGGYLFIIVPDEDLYEQGVFPSRFNPDHKVTFTIAKTKSWSSASINVLELVRSLPDASNYWITLHDHGYVRGFWRFGQIARTIRGGVGRTRRAGFRLPRLSNVLDQTLAGALAQIQMIVQKRSS